MKIAMLIALFLAVEEIIGCEELSLISMSAVNVEVILLELALKILETRLGREVFRIELAFGVIERMIHHEELSLLARVVVETKVIGRSLMRPDEPKKDWSG